MVLPGTNATHSSNSAAPHQKGHSHSRTHSPENADLLPFPDSRVESGGKVPTTLTTLPAKVQSHREGPRSPELPPTPRARAPSPGPPP